MSQNRDPRSENLNDILQNRFVSRVFKDSGKEILTVQEKFMASRGFEHSEWYSGRSFNVSDNALEIEQLKVHRFVDMKTITGPNGKHNKNNHPVYNRIMWGNYNNIIRELKFGFTDAVKAELKTLEDQ